MNKILMAAFAAVLLLGTSLPASAGSRPATEGWHDVWGPNRMTTEAAVAAEMKRAGGFGPANVTQTTNIDEATTNVYNQGPQNSSNATNINNYNETSTSVKVGDGNNGVTITPSSVSRQNSGTTTQGGNAHSSTADNGGSVNSNSSATDNSASSTNSDTDQSGSW